MTSFNLISISHLDKVRIPHFCLLIFAFYFQKLTIGQFLEYTSCLIAMFILQNKPNFRHFSPKNCEPPKKRTQTKPMLIWVIYHGVPLAKPDSQYASRTLALSEVEEMQYEYQMLNRSF